MDTCMCKHVRVVGRVRRECGGEVCVMRKLRLQGCVHCRYGGAQEVGS